MKMCFVQHEPFVGPGYYMTWAHQRKYDTQIVDCHRETPAPDLEQHFDMLVVLGARRTLIRPLLSVRILMRQRNVRLSRRLLQVVEWLWVFVWVLS